MISFGKLWNLMEATSPLMGSGNEDRALAVVRSGKDLRNEDEGSFWDDFISLCSNDGLAELLDVPKDKISTWPSKIREYLDKIESHDSDQSSFEKEKKELIPTGDTGALTVNADNSDPDLGAF